MLAQENPIFEKATERLVYVSSDKELRAALQARRKFELDRQNDLLTIRDKGWEEGKKEGREEGREEGKNEILASMLKSFPAEAIAEATGLPLDSLLKLK